MGPCRGGVATCSAGAAAGQAADHRNPRRGHGFALESIDGRVCTAVARTRLDRGLHRRDRVSLGGGDTASASPRSRPEFVRLKVDVIVVVESASSPERVMRMPGSYAGLVRALDLSPLLVDASLNRISAFRQPF